MLVDILRKVHEAKIVHCDLSLSNMYFLPDGKVRAKYPHPHVPY